MIPDLLRVPAYRRWLGGRAVSWFGDTLMGLVLGMWVKSLTGSNSRAALTMTFYVGPQLLAPLAGLLVDTLSRRLVLTLGNLLSALALVPLVAVHDASDVGIVWGVAAVYGVSGVILPAASMALQRAITPDELIAGAQGLQQGIGNVLQLLGPVVGAALFGLWGGVAPAGVAAACFLAGALLFATFRDMGPRTEVVRESLARETAAGLRHIVHHRELFDVMAALLLMEACAGVTEGCLYSVTDTFGRPPQWAGSITFAQGIGMVLGSVVAVRVIARLGERRTITAGLTAAGLATLACAMAPTLWAYLTATVALGLFLPWVFVATGTLQQRLTPPALMGRVGTALAPLFSLASVGSMAVGAWLVSFWSFRAIYPIVSAGSLLAVVWLLLRGQGRPVGADL